jgi:hypothetical protein
MDTVSDKLTRKLMAAVPQDPQSEKFVPERLPAAMRAFRDDSATPREDYVAFTEKSHLFWERLTAEAKAGRLNTEGYWEFHTRLTKFALATIGVELFILGDRRDAVISEELTDRIEVIFYRIYTDYPRALVDVLSKELNAIGPDFKELEAQHLKRAEKAPGLVALYTWVG